MEEGDFPRPPESTTKNSVHELQIKSFQLPSTYTKFDGWSVRQTTYVLWNRHPEMNQL